MLGQGLEKRTLALACPGSFQTPSFTISVVWEIFVAPLIFNFPIWKKKKMNDTLYLIVLMWRLA